MEKKLNYDTFDEISYQIGLYTIKQKKNKDGILMEKCYLYTNESGGGDYYNTTAFATFSQMYLLEAFIKQIEDGKV